MDESNKSRPKAAFQNILVVWRLGEAERHLVLPPIGQEAYAGETENKHCPCGGLGDRRYRDIINDRGGLRGGGLGKPQCF